MNKEKNKIIVEILLGLCIFGLYSTFSFANSTAITNGLSWLTTNQNSDGSFGITETSILDTTNVLDTLRLLQPTSTTYLTGVTWLSSQSVTSTDFLARQIISLSSVGVGITSDLTNLLGIENIDNGWGGDISATSMINDTVLALDALNAVNYSNQTTISNAILYLVTNQNSDGGWGFYAGDDSNVYMTAMVLQVFDELKATYNLSFPISNAAQYLLSHQNSDGGFGSSPSTVYETALSFLALLKSGQGSALPLQSAINYITTTQSADGSWNEDAYSTALALRALGSYLPNLYINESEIGISYTAVTVGSIISISAILHNNGGLGATNATVALQITGANGASSIVDSTIVPSIDAGQSQALSFTWNTQGFAGKNTVCVTADPNNLIEELNKADNTGCITINIGNLPDLVVPSSGISFTSTDGTHVTITASVYNLGESPAGSFNVGIYDGSVTNPIAIINVPGLAAGQRITVTTLWNASGAYGYHNILVVADPDNAIEEVTKANNIGSQGYWIRPTLDLAITSADITVNPSTPLYNGETFTLNVTVHNYGSQEADNVLVTAQSTYGDMTFEQAYVTVPGGKTAVAQIQGVYQGTNGMNSESVRVIVDPYNQFQELTKTNNSANVIVPIATSFVDLVFTDNLGYTINFDSNLDRDVPMYFSPQPTAIGQTVTITVNIKNIGTYPYPAITPQIAFYNGNPDNGGVLIGTATATISSSSPNPTVSIQWIVPASSQIIYARIDPNSAIPNNINKTNNTIYRTLSIGTTDLSISDTDLTFTPFAPLPGQSFTINAVIHNNSATNATGILNLYQGNPNPAAYLIPYNPPLTGRTIYNPIYIASLPISVTAGSAITVTVPWVMQNGSPNIYAIIDHIQPEDIDTNSNQYFNDSINQSVYMKYLIDPKGVYPNPDSRFYLWSTIMTAGNLTGSGRPEIVAKVSDQWWTAWESIKIFDIESNGKWKELTNIPLHFNDTRPTYFSPGLINIGNKPAIIDLEALQATTVSSYAVAYDSTGNTLWKTYLSSDGGFIIPGSPAFGDLEGNGITDVVIPSYSPSGSNEQISINVLNTQTGNIIWSKTIPNIGGDNWLIPFQAAVVDLNGNGKNDLVVSIDGTLTVFHSDGSIWWQLPYNNITTNVTGFGIADLNMDGKPEIIVLNDSYPLGSVDAYSYDGKLLWTYQPQGTVSSIQNGFISIGDINNDGFPEIVFWEYNTVAAGSASVVALNHEGTVLWKHTMSFYNDGYGCRERLDNF